MNKKAFYVIWSRDGDFVRMGFDPYNPDTDGADCDVCNVYDDDSVEAHSPRWSAYSLPGVTQRPDWLTDAIAYTGYNTWPMFNDGTDGIGDYYSGYDGKVCIDDIYKVLDKTDLPWDDYPDLDYYWFLTPQKEACWWEDFANTEYSVRDILENEVKPVWDLIHGENWTDVEAAFRRQHYAMEDAWKRLDRDHYKASEDILITAAHTLAEDLRDVARDAGLINE